jgi:hypothetical protein
MPISGRIPIAVSTGDNSTRPEWQAEPVEAATPSSRARMSAPTWFGKATFSVFGRRYSVTVEHDATCQARARPARSLGNN